MKPLKAASSNSDAMSNFQRVSKYCPFQGLSKPLVY